jgi:hypothetical protein
MNMPTALPLQQHPHFAQALRRLGRDVVKLDVAGAHPVVAVRVFGQLMASRGPIWRATPDDTAKADALARSGLRLVNAATEDRATLNAAGFRKLATVASVAELDLRKNDTARLAAAHGKWRNQWRRAQAAPVTIREERFDRLRHQWLLDADHTQQKQKRFRSLPHVLIDALAAQRPDTVTVHVAYQADDPRGAMLFVKHHPAVTYHLGWISPAARQWGLHHRILMQAATTFSERGYLRLDLGAVDTDAAPGLARFKIASGAHIRPLGGSWLRFGR